MTAYTLNVQNDSTNSFDFCVFQKAPDLGNTKVFSLAWFAQHAHPTTKLSFTWTIDYSFVWDQTGELRPGVRFDASQVWQADPADPALNTVTLTYPDEAYTFERDPGGPSGALHVHGGADLPLRDASVGIGMSGSGAYVVQAQPNLNWNFSPHPEYWVAAGTFEQGEVLDLETITNVVLVRFEDNVYSTTVTLNEDNSWTSGTAG